MTDRRGTWRAIAIASLLTLAGCDPNFVLQGRLVDADGRPVPNGTTLANAMAAVDHARMHRESIVLVFH